MYEAYLIGEQTTGSICIYLKIDFEFTFMYYRDIREENEEKENKEENIRERAVIRERRKKKEKYFK